MKKRGLLVLLILVLLAVAPALAQDLKIDSDVEIYFFYGQGCPHCGRMESFLSDMAAKYDNLSIINKETYFNVLMDF